MTYKVNKFYGMFGSRGYAVFDEDISETVAVFDGEARAEGYVALIEQMAGTQFLRQWTECFEQTLAACGDRNRAVSIADETMAKVIAGNAADSEKG